MRCPECPPGESSVYPGGMTSTAMMPLVYWDEKDVSHVHDYNVTTTSYSCSKGHSWSEETRGRCPCGWSYED